MTIGIFDLKTPRDLLAKLKFDLERVRRNHTDQYAAFDFFVTAEHMLDWVYPDAVHGRDAEKKRREERKSSIHLAIASHVANGSKHFTPLSRHHNSISGSEHHKGEFTDEFTDEFDIAGLTLKLDGEAKDQLGEVCYCHTLAEHVHAYWERRLTELDS